MKTFSLSLRNSFMTLLRADVAVRLRRWKSLALTMLLPVAIILLGKSAIDREMISATSLLMTVMMLCLPAIGLIFFPQSLNRDREHGILQRLYIAPVPSWMILLSRWVVYMGTILLMTLSGFLCISLVSKARFQFSVFALVLGIILLCGALFLDIGQLMVSRIMSNEVIAGIGIFVYILPVIAGLVAHRGGIGRVAESIVTWSPYGTAGMIMRAAAAPDPWNATTWIAFGVTWAYALCAGILGVLLFRWRPE